MSEENVEIVRRVYAAFTAGNWDEVFGETHPDFEMTTQRGPGAGTHRQREGAQGFLEDYAEAFANMVVEPQQFLEAGEQVVAVVTRRGRPKGSDVEMVVRNGHLWTIRDGQILSMVSFPDPEKALEAAGLSE